MSLQKRELRHNTATCHTESSSRRGRKAQSPKAAVLSMVTCRDGGSDHRCLLQAGQTPSTGQSPGTAPGAGQPDLEIARLVSDLFPGSHFQEVDGVDACNQQLPPPPPDLCHPRQPPPLKSCCPPARGQTHTHPALPLQGCYHKGVGKEGCPIQRFGRVSCSVPPREPSAEPARH